MYVAPAVAVSVPSRGLYISNEVSQIIRSAKRQFPSPLGDYISLIDIRKLLERYDEFPSPLGDYISLISEETVKNLNKLVSVPSRGLYISNLSYVSDTCPDIGFRPLSGTIYL